MDQRAAQTGRIKILNEFLVDWFIRTRTTVLTFVINEMDASDDPTHGQQVLTGFHGYFDQHQYFPLFAFDGMSGFPLAAWLRPGTVHSSTGAIDTLALIVRKLRAVWPNLLILVRGDTGFAIPDMYEFCETEGLLYAFGFGSNNVLKERTNPWLADLELYYACYSHREEHVQRFEWIDDYQADDWTRPRRIIAKIEINRHGSNRRFVVTNLTGNPGGIYRGFYVQRGDVPERPIGELKNGLQADRLSTVAYALVVLFREATAEAMATPRALLPAQVTLHSGIRAFQAAYAGCGSRCGSESLPCMSRQASRFGRL